METKTLTIEGTAPLMMQSDRLVNPLDPLKKEIQALTGKRKKSDSDMEDAGEQTRLAEQDGMDEVRRALRKMGRRIVHVAIDQLDAGQRRENADALARFSQLRGMVKQITHVKAEE